MEISAENQDEHQFRLDDDEAYAGTEAAIWKSIRFFNRLEVVDLHELEDQTCSICRQPYDDPAAEKTTHLPVRLPCSHVFGKECLAKWITPFGIWEDNENGEWEREQGWFENPYVLSPGSADCPSCRRVLFAKPEIGESALGLEVCVMLFDRAYEKVGCRRSEREEESRADLIRYIGFHHSARRGNNIIDDSADQRWNALERFHTPALCRLFDFAIRRSFTANLTPPQARIRRNLEHISICGLDILLDDPLFASLPPLRLHR